MKKLIAAIILIVAVAGCGCGKAWRAQEAIRDAPKLVPGLSAGAYASADGRLLAAGIGFIVLGGIAFAASFFVKSKDLMAAGLASAAFGVAAFVMAIMLKPFVYIAFAMLIYLAALLAWFMWQKAAHRKAALSIGASMEVMKGRGELKITHADAKVIDKIQTPLAKELIDEMQEKIAIVDAKEEMAAGAK